MTATQINDITDHANATDCDVQHYLDLIEKVAKKGAYAMSIEGYTSAEMKTLERMGFEFSYVMTNTYIKWNRTDTSIFWNGIKYDSRAALINKVKEIISTMTPQEGFDFVRNEALKFDEITASALYDIFFVRGNTPEQHKTDTCKTKTGFWAWLKGGN